MSCNKTRHENAKKNIERQFEQLDGSMNIADVTSHYLNIDPNVILYKHFSAGVITF